MKNLVLSNEIREFEFRMHSFSWPLEFVQVSTYVYGTFEFLNSGEAGVKFDSLEWVNSSVWQSDWWASISNHSRYPSGFMLDGWGDGIVLPKLKVPIIVVSFYYRKNGRRSRSFSYQNGHCGTIVILIRLVYNGISSYFSILSYYVGLCWYGGSHILVRDMRIHGPSKIRCYFSEADPKLSFVRSFVRNSKLRKVTH